MRQAADEPGQKEGVLGETAARVQDAASVAQEKASELRAQGSSRLQEQFDRRSSEAGSQARSIAEALRRTGQELNDQGNSRTAQITGPAADRFERLGSYLEQTSGDDLMRDVESFARRRPWMLAGVGLLAGVTASRFMKASSEQRYGRYRQTSEQWPSRSGVGSSWSAAEAERHAGIPRAGVTARAGLADSEPMPATDDPLTRERHESTS
jgi:ElaB/YqjD/DUF883 family membrane-anchored ribosome-binding protein